MKRDYSPVIVFFVVIAVFSALPPARFLQWDDAMNLVNNDKWRGLSFENLKWMWTTRHYGPWQPLSWFTWAIDYELWGMNPEGFRRTNVLLHAMTASFVYLIGKKRFSREAGLFAALFFALHPLRVESVVWITERRDVLSGLFSVISVYAWVEERRTASIVSFALAVLSKGTAVAVIPFIFLLDRAGWRGLAPHVVIGIFASAMNLRGFGTGDLRGLDLPPIDRLLLFLRSTWFYAWKTILPFELSPYYALPLDPSAIRPFALPGAILGAALAAACFHKKVRAWAVPAWLAYAAALAPVSGLLQNGRQAAADRYSYLACLPFALLFGLAARRRGPALAVFAGLAVLSVRQARIWRDDVALWTRAVEVEPESYLPRSNLSVALLRDGRGKEAIPHLEKAVALEPRDAEALGNLGFQLASNGEPARAIEAWERLAALRPDDPKFAGERFNLGVLLRRAGREKEGLARVREAFVLDPALKR